MALIEREAAKAKKVYCEERHEYVVPVAELDWLPTIDAAPVVHGRWEQGDMYDCGDVCSECDYDTCYTPCDMRYCPNCGARMDGGEGDG